MLLVQKIPFPPAPASPLRAFAIGDAFLAPPRYDARSATTPIVSYQSASTSGCLRAILPGLALEDADIAGRATMNTVSLAAEIDAIAAAHSGHDLALVSVGLVDCEQTIRGVAPEHQASVAALERIVGALLHAGIRPVMLLPPPHPLFANGLFAERFICVSATLRRLARQFPELILVDPTETMKQPGGFGIDPRPDFVDADQGGKLTVAATFVLAELIADALIAAFPAADLAGRRELEGEALLSFEQRASSDVPAGGVPAGFVLDETHAGGIAADAAVLLGEVPRLRVRASGTYSSQWPFLRLHRALQPSLIESFAKGSPIAAEAAIGIDSAARGLASVSLQLTPVWETGYVGLSSSEFHGQLQIGSGRIRQLRTPVFLLPGPLKALSVSLMMHFLPGTERTAEAVIDVMAIHLAGVSRSKA